MILSLGLLEDDCNQSCTFATLTVCVTLRLRASISREEDGAVAPTSSANNPFRFRSNFRLDRSRAVDGRARFRNR